jgi:hypothetical protein
MHEVACLRQQVMVQNTCTRASTPGFRCLTNPVPSPPFTLLASGCIERFAICEAVGHLSPPEEVRHLLESSLHLDHDRVEMAALLCACPSVVVGHTPYYSR